MKFLITGFEPFYTNASNPSGDILKDLEGDNIYTLLLPVSYLRTGSLLEDKIKKIKPDVVISLGLAQARKILTLELCGINYRKCSIPDNDNYLTNGEKIVPDGKDAYFTSFDLPKLRDLLNSLNLSSDISTTAGAYVCNTVYYHILRLQEKYNFKALFIHLPDPLAISKENDTKALKAIIDAIEETK